MNSISNNQHLISIINKFSFFSFYVFLPLIRSVKNPTSFELLTFSLSERSDNDVSSNDVLLNDVSLNELTLNESTNVEMIFKMSKVTEVSVSIHEMSSWSRRTVMMSASSGVDLPIPIPVSTIDFSGIGFSILGVGSRLASSGLEIVSVLPIPIPGSTFDFLGIGFRSSLFRVGIDFDSTLRSKLLKV